MRSGHRLAAPTPNARRSRVEQKHALPLAAYRGGRLPVASLIALLSLGSPTFSATELYPVPRLDDDLNVVLQPQDDAAAVWGDRRIAPAKAAAPACVAIHELTLSGVTALPVSELLAGLPKNRLFFCLGDVWLRGRNHQSLSCRRLRHQPRVSARAGPVVGQT